MASPTDRMAAGAGFGALARADELKKRLWFTVGALIIYRLWRRAWPDDNFCVEYHALYYCIDYNAIDDCHYAVS